MKDQLLRYFRERRRTAVAYLLIGTLALAGSSSLLFWVGERVWQGLLISIIGLAFIECWTGFQLWRQTLRLEGRLPDLLRLHPGRYQQEERARCEREEARYHKQRTIVLLLIVLGVVLSLVGGVIIRRPFTAGMGFGLCLQGGVLLVLNLTAHWHQSLYQHAVERFDG